ncbi:MAG: DUF5683 domain-containing protein [candidate division Zixibacteria bacterium]|nr:DUF5683 domain-containing protein [candidate division Zixibacteria bacterium]
MNIKTFLVSFCLLALFFSTLGAVENQQPSSPVSIEGQFRLSLTRSEALNQLSEKHLQDQSDDWTNEFHSTWKRKSPSRALLLSLLLPGAGQYYNDSKTKAGIFLGAEASLWVGYFAFRMVGNWKKTDYRNFAVAHAGINPDGKDDDFYERMTFYDTRDEYNQLTRLYNGPEAPIYPESEYWNWEWDNTISQSEYRDLRNQSKTAFRRSLYMVGLAGVNRIISALEAFRGARRYNQMKAIESEEIGFHPEIRWDKDQPQIRFTASKSFY